MKFFYSENLAHCVIRMLASAFICCVLTMQAQAMQYSKPAEGTDFIFSFAPNVLPLNGVDPTMLTVVVASREDTSGSIEIPLLNQVIPFTVKANVATSVAIPNQMNVLPWNVVSTYGIHLTALKPVSVNIIEQHIHSSDSTFVLPTKALGKEHIAMAYNAFFSFAPSQIAIVGTKDNTKVTITPSVKTAVADAGKTYTLTLNKFETFLLTKPGGGYTDDLTGTKIQSSEPVSITSGVQITNTPDYGHPAADYLVETTPPVELWGKSFTTLPLATRLKGDLFRILASKDNTVVKINGAVVATLSSGTFYDKILITASTIETSEPALVEQYSLGADYDNIMHGLGDPFMMMVVPNDRFLKHYTFATPEVGYGGKIVGNYCQGCWKWNNDPVNRPANYINIVIPTAAVASVILDGTAISPSLFKPIGNGDYSGAQIKVSSGSHTLDSVEAFALYSYGFESSESYGHLVGMAIDSATSGDYNNVRITSSLATNGVELDVNSFTVAPNRIETLADHTNIEWVFPTFSIGQEQSLDYEVVAKNLKAGEKRTITNNLEMVYEDLNGVQHKRSLGSQLLEVMASGFNVSVMTDRATYNSNESVHISPKVENLGAAQQTVNAELILLDAQAKPVFNIGSQPAVVILGNATRALSPFEFSTGTLYAGAYVIRTQLKDQSGNTLAVTDTPITLAANNVVQAAAKITTNKSAYKATDSVEILSRVTNTSQNQLIEKIDVVARILNADGNVIWSETSSVVQFLPQSLIDKKFTVPLVSARAGKYKAVLTATQKSGAVLASDEVYFDIAESSVVSILKGSALASKPSIVKGEAQTCTYNLTNQGTANVVGQEFVLSVVRIDDAVQVTNLTDVANLAANESLVKLQPISALLLTEGNYACVLQVTEGGTRKNIAQGLFSVKTPPITVNADIHLGDKARLLVLVDPPVDGLSQNEVYLRTLLNSANWNYTIVNNSADFARELKQGGYSVFALLSKTIELDSFTQGLLKLQVDFGDGLVIANNLARKNTQLEEALGITARTNIAYNKGVALQQSPLGDSWERAFSQTLRTLNFTKNGSTIIGHYRNNLIGADPKAIQNGLGIAADFNAFVFENFTSLSSAVEGRLAVGGNLNLQNFSVGHKLNANSLSDVVLVGGNAAFTSGRVYYGNLLAAGSVAGVTNSVVYGMAKGSVVKGNRPLPFNVAGEQDYLRELSQNIATLPANGSVTLQWGGYKFKGDCTKNLQVFNVNAVELSTANSVAISCIPAGATVIFNVSGEYAAIQNIGLQPLASIRDKVLFNFPQAISLRLRSVGVEGSILAPYANISEPAGNINGQVIAKSWQSTTNGYMSISNYSFKGDLSAAMGDSTKNAVALYQYQMGKSVFIGFDTLGQARIQAESNSTAVNSFAQLLMSSLAYIHPSPLTTKAGKAIPFVISMRNKSENAIKGNAVLHLPANLSMITSGGFSAVNNAVGDWVYPFNLAGMANESKTIFVQLPANAGASSALTLKLQSSDANNATLLFKTELPVSAQ